MGLPPLTPYKPLSFKEFLYHTTSKRVGGGRRVIHPSPTLNTVNRKVQFSSRSSFMNPLNYTQRTRNSTHHYVTYHQIQFGLFDLHTVSMTLRRFLYDSFPPTRRSADVIVSIISVFYSRTKVTGANTVFVVFQTYSKWNTEMFLSDVFKDRGVLVVFSILNMIFSHTQFTQFSDFRLPSSRNLQILRGLGYERTREIKRRDEK